MTSSTRKFGAHRYPDGLGELRLMPDVIDGLALPWLRSVLVEREVGRGAVIVEAVGIEQPAIHPVPTILERFRGQVSRRTRPKNTSKTRCRRFL